MKANKYLVFSIKGKKYGFKSSSVINIIKSVKIWKERKDGKYIEWIEVYGMNLPVINLHQIEDGEENITLDKTNVIIVEISLIQQKIIAAVTMDSIVGICLVDDLLSYPFDFINSTIMKYKEAILMHKGEPLVILNLSQLWQIYQGQSIFSIYLAN